ncbi:hybrid sensor histidine kinase/response regulator [Rubrolithibacter danxiaensis]|uniref:hybrid sensor histidine kinase/response regulator n=1 Tax=Rubrolithibacter danxiaensis TaxID=3390805 RepID=UPI003BF7DECA
MAEKIKILYIDDEVNNLVGFKASFRVDYNIYVAANTTEAIEILRKHADIRIIFCDQRMPDKTGVQFFEEIRNEFPHPIRILLTGYTDIESVINAINRGNIFRYVKKPWTDTDIRSAINEGDKYYMTNSMLSIKNKELQKAYDELDKFAYSVTHDIRRPLVSILGAIELAQHINEMTEIREMLSLMEESVKNLDSFIQSIHDYYNINRGELQIALIDFNELIKELQETYRITAKMSNIAYNTHFSQQEPFRSDKMSLKIIMNNLLSNAFKYQRKNNPDKMVELNIKIANGFATISVRDNGIGIHESHIGEIFNLFFRATSEEVGSGFGLYTVKDALLKLNGEVKVQSVLGEGSIFTVTIPNK